MIKILAGCTAWFGAMLLAGLWAPMVLAQSDTFNSSGQLSGRMPHDPSSVPGGPTGGASLANFSELMQLIESTIAPDQWVNAGGTATMFPFRSGVRIDPEGVMERLEDFEQKDALKLKVVIGEVRDISKPTIRLDQLGAWQQGTDLRWISLHQLDEQLRVRKDSDSRASVAMELLGGLCRIDYVAFDAQTQEWLLGGPAGNIAGSPAGDLLHTESKLPPVLLEDLLAIAPHVLQGRGEFGCSIDPVQERLVAAFKMANHPLAQRDLRSDPERWSEDWKAELGRQRATVIGLPGDSPTGYALLIADAHMKRIALGLEPSIEGLQNYWLESDLVSQKNRGSMVRWWFALSEARIPCDSKRNIYHLESSNVRVMSEAQMLNQQGQRVVADRADRAADAFANKFTANFESLQRTYPVYGRLRHCFDLAVALEIVRSKIATGIGRPLPTLANSDVQTHLPVAPTEIDSVVATRRFSDGTVSAIVSGGVSIVPRSIHARLREHAGHFQSISLEVSPGDRDASNAGSQDNPFWR